MRDVKSLAAEIEAVSTETLAEAIRRQVVLLRFNEANTLDQFFDADEIQLLCTRAANAVKDHLAAEIAALQSRAFEDGARWMRERAAKTADYARQRAAMALQGSCDGSDTNRTRRDLAQSLKGQIAALPLQPEGERSDA